MKKTNSLLLSLVILSLVYGLARAAEMDTTAIAPKLIKNQWHSYQGDQDIDIASIVKANNSAEGLDLERIRFRSASGSLVKSDASGQIVSVVKGMGELELSAANMPKVVKYSLNAGSHVFVPSHLHYTITAQSPLELVRVVAPKEQVLGRSLIFRQERYLRAAVINGIPYRWKLTSQYLSRRVFLHHDDTLLSRNGDRISWFHTTMFDVDGLPANAGGLPVFKMSYNYRTEANICYDVTPGSKVRMARHPYADGQWADWRDLDNDTTYYLNETKGSADEETYLSATDGHKKMLRNRHEVYIPKGGHVSLFCIFDPAVTGAEEHTPGEYSEYGPVNVALSSRQYRRDIDSLKAIDRTIDQISAADARGEGSSLEHTELWQTYEVHLGAQLNAEKELYATLRAQGREREQVILQWMNTTK